LINGYIYTTTTGVGSIAFVQVNAATRRRPALLAIEYPLAQTAENLNIVVVGWNDATSMLASLTDSHGAFRRVVLNILITCKGVQCGPPERAAHSTAI
jgi:hypothetical protein